MSPDIALRRRRLGAPLLLHLLLLAGALLAGAGLGLASPAPAGAQEGNATTGEVRSYAVDLTLEGSGALRVHEEVEYRLGPGEEHGFRRFVPIEVDYDDERRRVYRIDGVSVRAEPVDGRVTSGAEDGVDDLATNVDDGQFVIRIGSATTFVTGTWRYSIDYTVRDAVETVDLPQIGTIEELAWNAIGTQWTIPLQRVTVTGTLPADPTSAKCFQGAYRSTAPCDLGLQGDTFSVDAGALAAGEAITIYADFPPGTVADATAVLEEKWTLARAFHATPVTLAGSALGSMLVVGGVGTLLSRQGRDRRLVLNAYLPAESEPETQGLAGFFEKPEGPVQFRPPDGMTPGLCGVLMDEKADPLDVSATVVDLAVRGYLRIEQVPDPKGGRKHDFNLRFLKPPDGALNAYEADLLTKLAAEAGGDAVLLSSLRTRFATQFGAVRKALYDETMRRHWFRRRPDHVRGVYAGIGLLVLLVGGAAAALLIAFTRLGLFALPLVLPGLLILFTANKMPSRSAEGRRQLELCVGYERFLEVADAEELKFTERQYDYVAGLPYAMVFGITHRWAQVLSVLQEQGVDLTPTWYVPIYPGGPFSYNDFGRSMSDFGSTAAAALSAPKPSSTGGGMGGGGFGGGFSGGGGGGGGGGGW